MKVTMLDMILEVEAEVGRLEAWERLAQIEGKRYANARRLEVYRALLRTLDRIHVYQAEVVRLLEGQGREVAMRTTEKEDRQWPT